MALPLFKQKCKLCRKEWVVVNYREFPICCACHMRQAFCEEITAKDFLFLNVDRKYYEQSRFLRSIRESYQRYKMLSQKQIAAFKKAVDDLKKPRPEEVPKAPIKVEDIEITGELSPRRKKKLSLKP